MNEERPMRSERNEVARSILPEELRPIFDQFVADYKFAGTIHHGSPFVSYIILAEMVKAGWRPIDKPIGVWAERPEGSVEDKTP
jgi:hypothetical protein